MRECPRCGSEESVPKADLHYRRECQGCLFVGEDYEFETDLEPTWSWHIVNHDDVAWQVIQIKHWPSRIEVEHLDMALLEDNAEAMIDTLRAAAPELGRELEYQHVDYK